MQLKELLSTALATTKNRYRSMQLALKQAKAEGIEVRVACNKPAAQLEAECKRILSIESKPVVESQPKKPSYEAELRAANETIERLRAENARLMNEAAEYDVCITHLQGTINKFTASLDEVRQMHQDEIKRICTEYNSIVSELKSEYEAIIRDLTNEANGVDTESVAAEADEFLAKAKQAAVESAALRDECKSTIESADSLMSALEIERDAAPELTDDELADGEENEDVLIDSIYEYIKRNGYTRFDAIGEAFVLNPMHLHRLLFDLERHNVIELSTAAEPTVTGVEAIRIWGYEQRSGGSLFYAQVVQEDEVSLVK